MSVGVFSTFPQSTSLQVGSFWNLCCFLIPFSASVCLTQNNFLSFTGSRSRLLDQAPLKRAALPRPHKTQQTGRCPQRRDAHTPPPYIPAHGVQRPRMRCDHAQLATGSGTTARMLKWVTFHRNGHSITRDNNYNILVHYKTDRTAQHLVHDAQVLADTQPPNLWLKTRLGLNEGSLITIRLVALPP